MPWTDSWLGLERQRSFERRGLSNFKSLRCFNRYRNQPASGVDVEELRPIALPSRVRSSFTRDLPFTLG
jgi:hypothetical protein